MCKTKIMMLPSFSSHFCSPVIWLQISGEIRHSDPPLQNSGLVNIHPWHFIFWLSSLFVCLWGEKIKKSNHFEIILVGELSRFWWICHRMTPMTFPVFHDLLEKGFLINLLFTQHIYSIIL